MDDYRRGGFGEAMGALGTLIVGAVIGAAIALLMAPKSGVELREDLKAGASKMGEQVSDASQRATESMRAQVQKIGEKAEEISSRVAGKIEETGDKAKGASEEI